MSERVGERLKQRSLKYSPGSPQEEPDDLGSEAAIPGCVHNLQEGPRNVENEHVVETNVHCRVRGLGGHMHELARSRGVKGDWRHQNCVKGVGYNRNRNGSQMDGATSGTHRDSKRVETDLLATEKEGQHERRKCTTSDVPRPSTPLPTHTRCPTKPVNPPCC